MGHTDKAGQLEQGPPSTKDPDFGIDLSKKEGVVDGGPKPTEKLGSSSSDTNEKIGVLPIKGGSLELYQLPSGENRNVLVRSNSKLTVDGVFRPQDLFNGALEDPKTLYSEPPDHDASVKVLEPRRVKLESNGGTISWEVQPDGKVLRESSYKGVISKDIIDGSHTNEGRQKWKDEIKSYIDEPKLSIEWKPNYTDDPHNPGHPGTHFQIHLPEAEAALAMQKRIRSVLEKLHILSKE